MGFLAAIPAAIGSLFGGGGAAALGAGAGAAGAGAGLSTASLIPAAAGAAATGAEVGAGALGAAGAAGATPMTLGSVLGTTAPLLGGLSKTASAGADLLGKFGDISLDKIFGGAAGGASPGGAVMSSPAPSSPMQSLGQGLKLGSSLHDLLGGGGGKPQMAPAPAMTPPAPTPIQTGPVGAQGTPTGPGGASYMPTAKLLSQMLFNGR
jgi:hypothetical protein